MKKIYTLFLGLFTLFSLGQTQVFFSEDFESGIQPFSVVTAGTASQSQVTNASDLFHTGKALSIDNSNAFGDTVYINLFSIPIDTLRKYNNAEIHFDAICSYSFATRVRFQYSTDNKVTWTRINAVDYIGASTGTNYSIDNYNGYLYPNWVEAANTSNLDSTMWNHDAFDISSLVPSSGAGNFYFRIVVGELFYPPSLPRNPTRFLLDNIKVLGSNCSPILPRIKLDTSSASICSAFNYNTKNFITGGTPLKFDVSLDSPSKIDSLYLEGFVNETDSLAIYNYSLPGASLNVNFNNSLKGLTYRIKAVNNCGNTQYYPPKGYYTIGTQIIPANCGSGTCNASARVFDTFPVVEDFESAEWNSFNNPPTTSANVRGDFATDAGQNWVVQPVENIIQNAFCVTSWNNIEDIDKAPSKSALKNGGSNYLLFRNDINTSDATSAIISPCIDLQQDSNIVLTFDYHGVGQNLSTFEVRIRNLSLGETLFSTVLDLKNNIQTSGLDLFKKAVVPLSSYHGSIIQVRIVAKSSSFSAIDAPYAAIDNFTLRESTSNDVVLYEFEKSNLSPCGTTTDSLFAKVLVLDTTLTSLPYSYSVNGTMGSSNLSLPTNRSITDTFLIGFPIASSLLTGNNSIKVWHSLSNDPDNSDDTLSLSLTRFQVLNTFPYHQNFESISEVDSLTEWSVIYQNPQNNNIELDIFNGIYPKNNSGPAGGIGKGSKYLTVSPITNGSVNLNQGVNVSLVSSCIDVSALSNPTFAFDYYFLGVDDVAIEVDYSTDGINFIPLGTTLQGSASFLPKSYQNWQKLTRSLTAIKNSTFNLRITFKNTSTLSNLNRLGAAIDNLSIYDAGTSTSDVSLYKIIDSYKGVNKTSLTTIVNSQTSGSTNLQLQIAFNPICGGAIDTANLSLTANLLSNRNSQLSFPGFQNFNLQPGEYRYTAVLSSPSNTVAINDTTNGFMTVYKEETIPYFNDFETCLAGANYSLSDYGAWNRRKQKTPASNTFSGSYSLNLDSLPQGVISNSEIVILPAFSGFDSISNPTISFHHKYHISPGTGSSGGRVEINAGSGWVQVDARNATNPVNWPNDRFYGPQSTYQLSSLTLPQLSSVSGTVQIRFVADNFSGGQDYWTIDDFRIDVPVQHNASPVSLKASNLVFANDMVNLELTVQNTGNRPLSSYTVNFTINGQPWFSSVQVPTTPVNMFGSHTFTTSKKLPANFSGNSLSIEAITSSPNGKQDEVAADDTIANTQGKFLTTSTSFPFCEDFENGNNPSVSNSKNLGSSNLSLWKNKNPSSKGALNSLAPGTNAIFTRDSSNYRPFEDESFYLAPFEINDSTCYRFTFKHYYLTERNYDGGLVEFSLDSGTTWQVMGSYDVDDSLWYNTQYVYALEQINPGFSGNSGGYIQAKQELSFSASGLLYIRFRFKSDFNNIVNEGWAIDDICFVDCSSVSLKENSINSQIEIFPNPFNDQFTIANRSSSDITKIEVFDANGKLLVNRDPDIQKPSLVISAEEFPKGVYTTKVTLSNGQTINKTLIKY